jgi:hypothetical protein
VNIVSPQFKANPFPFLADLRQTEPVHKTALPDKTPVFLISRIEAFRKNGTTRQGHTYILDFDESNYES